MIMTIMLAGTISAPAIYSHHEWVTLPGHSNIRVDLASFKQIKTGWFNASVNIRLNGHLYSGYWLQCGAHFSLGDSPVSMEGRTIGTIPSGAVEAFVCPLKFGKSN